MLCVCGGQGKGVPLPGGPGQPIMSPHDYNAQQMMMQQHYIMQQHMMQQQQVSAHQ